MKKTALLVIFALTFSITGCRLFYGLSEPELPVVYIEFEKAVYDPAKCEITLTFPASVTYDYSGIFPFYNHSEDFNMSYYLAGNDIKIKESVFEDNKIIIELIEDKKPEELIFKTNIPWYFYNYEPGVYVFRYYIEVKAYIATTSLPVET